MSNLIKDLLKEQGLEVTADNVRVRLNPEMENESPIDTYRRRHRRDPIKMIGEGTLALAVPFGVLSYLL